MPLADQETDQEPEVELRCHVHAPRVVSPSCYTGNVAGWPGGGNGRADQSGSMGDPGQGQGGAAQQMMVTETAYGPALNRYAANPPQHDGGHAAAERS
jgi:hypothetical protein